MRNTLNDLTVVRVNTTRVIDDLKQLRADIEILAESLRTLIAWIAESANSPLSVKDATRLMDELKEL